MSARTVRASLVFPRLYSNRLAVGSTAYSQARRVALRANPDVAAGSILDWRQRLTAYCARRYSLRVDALKPHTPVRPPGAFVLLSGLHPIRKRRTLEAIICPELVLSCRGWV